MLAAGRNLQRQCHRALSSLLQSNNTTTSCRNAAALKGVAAKLNSFNGLQLNATCEDGFPLFASLGRPLSGSFRAMSTSRGRSMRSKVEKRMRKESGKTLREIRRAKKLKKKLMTDEERLVYNLKRAKKKAALLLQKLKKYELAELAPAVHDPELFTPEQLHAYKKIGFKNKNYVPVGVRGVFGGVVQNMHLHWKFHETVQVSCGNFPKEKIKEMATMLARLSGGIVVNIHDVNTIIMFRGRNYRQPKNLIPFNTLTKRKALFKARFEQALESQKLNIKKIEQQLRRKGVNPEDPVAMASIQRVASTFFNAIDKKEGTPYVFHGDKQLALEPIENLEHSEPQEDSDQEELDRFIAEIEDAADKEWAAEEAAEKEEMGRIRYWNEEDYGGRIRRSETNRYDYADGASRPQRKRSHMHDQRSRLHRADDADDSEDDNQWDSDDDSDAERNNSVEGRNDRNRTGRFDRMRDTRRREFKTEGFRRNSEAEFRGNMMKEESGSDDNMLSDLDDKMWESEESDDEEGSQRRASATKKGTSDREDDDDEVIGSFTTSRRALQKRNKANSFRDSRRHVGEEDSESEGSFSDSKELQWESDDEEDDDESFSMDQDRDYNLHYQEKKSSTVIHTKAKTQKEVDETWDSD